MTKSNSNINFSFSISWYFVAEALETFPSQSNFQQIKAFGTMVVNFFWKFAIILIIIGLLTLIMFWLCNVIGTQKWCKTAVTIAMQNLAP